MFYVKSVYLGGREGEGGRGRRGRKCGYADRRIADRHTVASYYRRKVCILTAAVPSHTYFVHIRSGPGLCVIQLSDYSIIVQFSLCTRVRALYVSLCPQCEIRIKSRNILYRIRTSNSTSNRYSSTSKQESAVASAVVTYTIANGTAVHTKTNQRRCQSVSRRDLHGQLAVGTSIIDFPPLGAHSAGADVRAAVLDGQDGPDGAALDVQVETAVSGHDSVDARRSG